MVVWRGERILLDALPERIARTDDRMAREGGYALRSEALEALRPLYVERLNAWRADGDVSARAAKEGTDPAAMAASLERLSFNVETPYYAALRRYLALIGIEQGDASEADLWYIERGSTWSSWFGPREVRRALAAAKRAAFEVADLDGWRAVGAQLRGRDGDVFGTTIVGAAYATLIADTEWLSAEVGMAPDEVAAFVDFATFVRLMHLRRAQAELTYELRLYPAIDAALQRAYYSGIVGNQIGANVAEAGYLAESIGRSDRSGGWRRHCWERCWSRCSRSSTGSAGGARDRQRRCWAGSAPRRRWRTRLPNSGIMAWTGDPSCVRSGRGSSVR